MDPRDIPQHIIDRYATRGPRYTSYPTAPHFRTDYDRDAIEAAWRRTPAGDDGLSVYVHIPYCRKRCLYCGCHTEVLPHEDDSTMAGYVDRLLDEIHIAAELLGGSHRPLMQLALGGGTPTILPPPLMERLLDGIEQLGVRAGGEFSAEVDPRTITTELLDLLVERGFNRFSLGVQDLDPEVQQIVGRVQPVEQVEGVIDHLRSRAAAPAINIDLIQGLPGQTPESFRRTIGRVVQLDPDRLALFGYAHVPWIRPHQQALEGHRMPTAEERIQLLGIAWEQFVEAGYEPIGFDHYARQDDELTVALRQGTLHRNFMGYTTHRGLDMIGLGVSSIGAVGFTYTQDFKDHEPYDASLAAGQMPWERALELSDDDLLRREVILDLSCNLRLDLKAFRDRHDLDLRDRFPDEMEQLGPLQDDGLFEITDQEIRITPLGRFMVRNICMVFDAYLGSQGAAGQDVRYSKTL